MSDTLTSPFRTALGRPSLTKSVLMVIAGSLLLTLSAKVQVPFFPVPMTMQVLVVLLIGAAYGPKLAGATLATYLMQGAVGLPVFAGTPEKGIGLAYMVGPTGGYLLGFLVAAIAVGWMAERGWDRGPVRIAVAGLVGLVAIYAIGLAWLGAVVGWDQPVLTWGLWPFLPAEALKLALMVVIVHLGNSALRR
ncbi:MAG: biotin transporter BioY [Pseudomonadota bacterium]